MEALKCWRDRAQSVADPYLSDWRSRASILSQPYLTGAAYGVKPALPPKYMFRFPPADYPTTLPPPQESPNYERPFAIPSQWYNAALSPTIPITIALVYITLITYLNSVNRQRSYRPWAISKTAIFKSFVIIHNIFLATYSLWTFIGMVKALHVSVVDPREYGLAATMDSLCKLHGPRGPGSAATFNERSGSWGFTDRLYRLAKDGYNPEASDVGRIWNEGLAFYGWLFYISKYYEVVDTLIIIAKGKKSSFLQTYHHAGAMLCMWAGIRYMSPPIWLFVTANSLIHTVMYTFYTAITLGIKVPKPLKQVLTTLQIAQFVIGASYAFAHYFVAYQIPVSVPYIYHLGENVRDAATAIKSDASSAVSVATATASADISAWLKKLAFRAAGREGIAENVQNQFGQSFGIDAVHAAEDFIRREETRYRQELRWVNCLDTSGESFAIYLNILYLLPLTWLFLQFFLKAYINRVEERRRSSVGQKAYIAGQSMNDARKGVGRRLSEAFEDYQGANGDADDAGVDTDVIRKELQKVVKNLEKKGKQASETVSKKGKEASQVLGEKGKQLSQSVSQKAQQLSEVVSDKTSQTKSESMSSPSKQTNKSPPQTPSGKNNKNNKNKKATPAKSGSSSNRSEQTSLSQSESTSHSLSQSVSESVSDMASSVGSGDGTNQLQDMFEQLKAEAQAGAKKAKEAFNENVMSEETQEDLESSTWSVVQSAKKSVKKLSSEETTSNVADTAEKVEKDAERLASRAVEKGKETAGKLEETSQEAKQASKKKGEQAIQKAEGVKEDAKVAAKDVDKIADSQASEEKSQKTNNKTAVPDKAVEPTTSADSKEGPQEHDATVQEGLSFAAVAAEGVPEEEMGETRVVEKTEDDKPVKKEEDEVKEPESEEEIQSANQPQLQGQSEGKSDDEPQSQPPDIPEDQPKETPVVQSEAESVGQPPAQSLDPSKTPPEAEPDDDPEPESLSDKITDAMSSDISDSPYSYLSRSRSSLYDPELGTSPTTSPKKLRHSKRRG